MPNSVGRPKFSPTPSPEDRSERIATTEWTDAVMQSALPCPTRIRTGRQYETVEDQQIGFRLPIVIEAGASLIMAPGSTLYQN